MYGGTYGIVALLSQSIGHREDTLPGWQSKIWLFSCKAYQGKGAWSLGLAVSTLPLEHNNYFCLLLAAFSSLPSTLYKNSIFPVTSSISEPVLRKDFPRYALLSLTMLSLETTQLQPLCSGANFGGRGCYCSSIMLRMTKVKLPSTISLVYLINQVLKIRIWWWQKQLKEQQLQLKAHHNISLLQRLQCLIHGLLVTSNNLDTSSSKNGNIKACDCKPKQMLRLSAIEGLWHYQDNSIHC